MGELATLGRNGHSVATWDEALPETVTEARVIFDEKTKNEGFAAFRTIATGPATQIREFDPTAERIVLTTPHQGG